MLALSAASALLLSACADAHRTQPAATAAVAPKPGPVVAAGHGAATALTAVKRCAVAGAAARAHRAVAVARRRYRQESSGSVIHADLRQIAHDRALIAALSANRLGWALGAAERQLFRHVVRIRVTSGQRLLVDANPSSFDVAGSAMTLYARHGRRLGRLEISVQDVIGFIKLALRRGGAAAVVVRARGGPVRASPAAWATRTLPRRGCVVMGGTAYVVSSFVVRGFVERTLDVWILVAA